MDKFIRTNREIFSNIDGIGILNLKAPKSPKLIIPFYEDDPIKYLIASVYLCEKKVSEFGEEEYYEFPKSYGRGFIFTAIRIYTSEFKIMKEVVKNHIENEILIEEDLLKYSFNTSLESIEKSAVSFKELKDSYLQKWNDLLNGELIYYNPKEIEKYKEEYGGIPASNKSVFKERYWIDEINKSLIKGDDVYNLYLRSKRDKVVSTVAIRRAIKWLNELAEGPTSFFHKLATELNEKQFTKNCTKEILEGFFKTEFEIINPKLNWILKRGNNINRTPLFQLIAVLKKEWLNDSSGIYKRITSNVRYVNQKDEISKLKVSFTSWHNKYHRNGKSEVKRIISLLPTLNLFKQ